MKCHWCDKETNNLPDGEHLDMNGNQVVLCDCCQKSSDEGLIGLPAPTNRSPKKH